MNAIVNGIANSLGDKALFIGGVAVECYAPYRRTHDIDVVVRERDFPALRTFLVAKGFAHSRPPHLAKHAFKAREAGELDVYTTSIGDVRVDEGMFRRGGMMRYGDTRVLVASLEDLLCLKLAARREIDLSDVAVLLHERGRDLDVKLLRELGGVEALRSVSLAIPDMLPEEYGWQARQKMKTFLREMGLSGPARPRRQVSRKG